MKTGELIVKSHRPWRRRILLIGAAVSALLVALGFYELGQLRAGFNVVDAADTERQLRGQLDEQTKATKALHEQIAVMKRSQEIDRESYDVVRTDLKQLQEEILELRQEVEFYRGIVSPAERMAGINIQSFKLLPAVEEGLYHFELVLSQVLKNDRYVRGVVKLHLQGVQDGEPQTLDFREITPNKSVPKDFRFRYFQQMEGDIRMPSDFIPRTVLVEMMPRGRKSISKSFPWDVSSD
jgi:predicted RND superfamily exporter protein